MEKETGSRRQFLRQISHIAGASIVLPSIPVVNACAQGNTRKLGVALAGLGNYSTSMLGPALRETVNCHLSGIVTGTPAKAEKWMKEYNILKANVYSYDNFDDIASNENIDIVYIVLPNGMHAEFSIRALQAGKHVICEKPMAMNAAEARQMIEAARKAKRMLAIGYRMHYDPYFIEVKKLGQSEALGPINYIETSLGYSFTPEMGSWKLKKSMGGGSLYNLAVYPIQSSRHVKGTMPVYVTGQATVKRREYFTEIDELFTWQLEWEDGTLCNSYSGPVAYIDRLWAGCTDGFIELNPATAYTGQAGRSTKGEFKFEQVFQQKLQIDDFARCIMDNKESIVKGEEGWKDMLIIDAIHQSIQAGGEKVKVEVSDL